MAGARKLEVVIAGDAKGALRAFDQIDRGAGGLGKTLGGLGKAMALGVGALAVGGVALGKGFVDAAVESQKVTKQTEAVLKSMGDGAGVTATQIAKMSEKLSMQTGIDDELIQSGQNVLLTFGNVRNEVGKGNDIFDRTTLAAVNMSAALGTDLSAANIQLGKALNDPIKGITALSRAGVSFTAQQKDQIKAMVESGDTLGAQKIILGEMEKQFGGSAAAQATAGDRLKVVWGNLQEQLGAKLLPVVEKVAGWLADKLPGAMDKLGGAFRAVMSVLTPFFNTLRTGFTEDEGTPVENFALKVRDLWDALKPVIAAVGGALVTAFKALASFITGTAVPAIQKLFGFLMDHKEILVGVAVAIGVGLVAAFTAWAVAAGAAAVATIAALAPIIAIGVAIAALVAGVIYAYKHWDWFREAVDKVARFATGVLWPALQAVGGWIAGTLVPIIASIISWLAEKLVPAFQSVAGFIMEHVIPAVAAIIEKLVEWGTKAAEIVVAIITKVGEIVTFFKELPGKIGGFIAGMWDKLKEGLKAAIDWIVKQIDRALGPIDEILGKLGALNSKAPTALGGGSGTRAEVDRFRGARALGGPVSRGMSYLVGERGPEMFTPGRSGRITPNGGGMSVNININGGSDDAATIARKVRDELLRIQRRNVTVGLT